MVLLLDRYQAVFFDVGGTLLKVHPSVGDVYARHAREHGFEGSAADLNRTFRQAWKTLGGLESLGRQQGLSVERGFWREVVRRTFDPHGGLDRFEVYFDHIYEVFRDKECWRLFTDVAESRLLDTLAARGVIMGIISNWDSRLPEIIESLGLDKYFRFVLASTVVGAAKPDPLIFQEALTRSGVPPEAACHIGDEVDTDVNGARAAGLDAVLVDRKGRHEPAAAFPIVSSFHEFSAP
ncbi:MAG: HAD-IA family hydrolase [Nitrospinaceae bacterium]